MDIRDIGYIVAVAEEKTLTQAAKRLFISQPALSQAIQRMEKQLGVLLFDRGGSTLTLTAAGHLLVEEGRALLRGQEELMAQIRRLSDVHRETLRFGISPFYSKYYLPGIYRYYAEHLPGIRLEPVEYISRELERMVAEDKLELCFVPAFPAMNDLVYRTVAIEEIFLGVPPEHPANARAIPSAAIPYMDLANVKDEPFILQPAPQKVATIQNRVTEEAGFTPKVIYESLNWDTIYVLTGCGLGLSFLPEILRVVPLNSPRPNFYRIAGMDVTRPYAVAYRKEKGLSHKAEQLVEIVAATLSNLKNGG